MCIRNPGTQLQPQNSQTKGKARKTGHKENPEVKSWEARGGYGCPSLPLLLCSCHSLADLVSRPGSLGLSLLQHVVTSGASMPWHTALSGYSAHPLIPCLVPAPPSSSCKCSLWVTSSRIPPAPLPHVSLTP